MAQHSSLNKDASKKCEFESANQFEIVGGLFNTGFHDGLMVYLLTAPQKSLLPVV